MKDPNEMNPDEVAVCKVIVCTKERRGKGTHGSPVRVITEVFDLDGKKIAEHDPVNELFTDMDVVHFCQWWIERPEGDKREMAYPKPADVQRWLQWLESKPNS